MKRIYSIFGMCVLLTLSSCVEELQTENYYTFTGETITDYVENRESLSMFADVLDEQFFEQLLIDGRRGCLTKLFIQ